MEFGYQSFHVKKKFRRIVVNLKSPPMKKSFKEDVMVRFVKNSVCKRKARPYLSVSY